MPRLLIAASGTGGHIFPALAVAQELPSFWAIEWLGVPDRLETRIVPPSYPLTTVRVAGLQGSLIRKIVLLIRLIAATKFIFSFIKRKRIEVLFTTGGYIAAPSILAAKLAGIKIMLHESNGFPGTVTRVFGRLCDLVALGTPSCSQYLIGFRTIVTGTPVRDSFYINRPLPTWVPAGNGPLIVVIGGSQGSVGLNRMVRHLWPSLLAKGCRIVHLVGDNDQEALSIQHKNLVVKSFSNEMPALLQHADLAISRAGAGIIAELSISVTPAVLVPYPAAKDNHQTINALCAAAFGAATIVHENRPEHKGLESMLDRILGSRLVGVNPSGCFLQEMQTGMKDMAIKNAEKKLVDILLKFS
tara:strand:+ start:500 stop:1573 length:1074 start_codon:yes stop_codon:yes gene_type:complete